MKAKVKICGNPENTGIIDGYVWSGWNVDAIVIMPDGSIRPMRLEHLQFMEFINE